MSVNVSTEEKGNAVIDSNGQRIATVVRIESGVPYVEPNGEVRPMVRMALGWGDDDGPYPLMPVRIDTVTDSEIYLKSNL